MKIQQIRFHPSPQSSTTNQDINFFTQVVESFKMEMHLDTRISRTFTSPANRDFYIKLYRSFVNCQQPISLDEFFIRIFSRGSRGPLIINPFFSNDQSITNVIYRRALSRLSLSSYMTR